MKQFEHGGDIISFAKEINTTIDQVVDLSSNINFLQPSVDTNFSHIKINSYPKYDQLYQVLANKFNILQENIELYNGASSAIFSLIKNLSNQICTIYSPAYLEYKKAASLYHKDIVLINRLTNIEQEVPKNSIVIFVNPSTPDGQFYNIEDFLIYWKKQNCKVIIDESFLEFSNQPSAIKYLQQYDNLYIIKSLTKFYSCAGVRLGIVISSKINISLLQRKEPLWKISIFDSYYIQQALKDTKFIEISRAINANAKVYLEDILTKSYLFDEYIYSYGNFILVKLKYLDAKIFQDKLKKYKIMVRDCSNFDFLDKNYVRIAVKSIKDLKKFEKAIKKIQENL